MKAYTIRGIDDRLYKTLQAQAKNAGKSLNRHLLDLVGAGVRPPECARMKNLDKYCGIYTADEAKAAQKSLACQRTIEPGMWK